MNFTYTGFEFSRFRFSYSRVSDGGSICTSYINYLEYEQNDVMSGFKILEDGSFYVEGIGESEWQEFHNTSLLSELEPTSYLYDDPEENLCPVDLAPVTSGHTTIGYYLPLRLLPDLYLVTNYQLELLETLILVN